MTITFRKVPQLPDRDLWYRMPDREHQSTTPKRIFRTEKRISPTDLLFGDWITYKRVIIRCGYWIEPKDMPFDLLKEQIERHIRNYSNYSLSHPHWHKLPMDHFYTYADSDWDGPITPEMVKAFIDSLGFDDYSNFGRLVYRLRGKWASEQSTKDVAPHNLRTFWYVDCDFSTQVDGLYTKKVGLAHAASTWGGPDDYEPGYFEQWCSQRLYQVGHIDNVRHNLPAYVHPLDIE